MLIFEQVISRLRENDTILKVGNTQLLNIKLSERLGDRLRSSRNDVEELDPLERLRPFVIFGHDLFKLSQRMNSLPFCPDFRYPESEFKFKKSEDVILAFCKDNPVWYWKSKDGYWQLHAMCISRSACVDESFDFVNGELTENDEAAGEENSNDPRDLTPLANLGVIKHFITVLQSGHANLNEEPYYFDTLNPNTDYRFRYNDQFIVAYRCTPGRDHKPVWCWKKQQGGFWKLYRLQISVIPDRFFDLPVERVMTNGAWE